MKNEEQLVLDAIDSIAQKRAANTAPQSKLCTILAAKSIAKLKELARFYRIKGYTKMNREQLAAGVCSALTDAERLEELLYILESPTWVAFDRAAQVVRLPCDGVLCAHLDLMQSLGYAQTYFYEETLCAVVPTEIREVFQSLLETGFRARKERGDLLHAYATAAINLYGIISQDEFVALFNAQNENPTDIDEVFQTLIKHIVVRSDYCFWDEYIVSDCFEEEDFAGAETLLEQTDGKQRYIPSQTEFLKYYDAAYYEQTEETRALTQYLNTLVPDSDEAQYLTDEICFECAMECQLSVIFDLLEKNGVVLNSRRQVEQFSSILMSLKNNSRIWINKGHTPKEMFKQFYGKVPIPFPGIVKPEKIGRNAPCPCGSGKKYKKCCGR